MTIQAITTPIATFADGEKAATGQLYAAVGNPEDGMFASFPVDTVALATTYGIAVERVRFDDKTTVAVLVKDVDEDAKILISKSVHKNADIRLICAVEIGRVFENMGEARFGMVEHEGVFCGRGVSDFARGFADGLLMPASVIRSMYADGKSIGKIARTLGVSKDDIFLRLARLGLAG